MDYSFMTFSCPTLALDDALAAAKRFGYGGIEPRIQAKHAHGIELSASAAERAAARSAAGRAGIALCCLATSCSFADPATAEAQAADVHRAIDLAGDVGAPCLRVFGGRIPDGVTREQAAERIVGALRGAADHAAERGVTVCMETHDSWCSPADVAGIMRRVAHPAIAVNWDIMHPVRVAGATMGGAFAALRAWIRHVHFHDGRTADGKLVMLPIGQGEVDHGEAVRLLREAGYSGFLSGEWINWEPWETHLPRELAAMRKLEESQP